MNLITGRTESPFQWIETDLSVIQQKHANGADIALALSRPGRDQKGHYLRLRCQYDLDSFRKRYGLC
jgi:hypothetical protein